MTFETRIQANRSMKTLTDAGSEDLQYLQPFVGEVSSDAIKLVRLLHVSALSRSFFVEFREGSQYREPMVVKSYGPKGFGFAQQEVQHIQWVQKVIAENGLKDVLVPQVVWACLTKGLFATRYIPGEDLNALFRKRSRLWRLSSVQEHVLKTTRLIRWHKVFFEAARLQGKALALIDNQAAQWNHWVRCVTSAEHLSRDWRMSACAKLERLKPFMAKAHESGGVYHGDFTTWNVRVDPFGQLWVLDWRRLERGHWLEGAYRFIYSLRVSGLSPLAKPGFYTTLAREADVLLQHLVADEGDVVKELYRLRAALRNLFYMCSCPPLNLKQRIIQRFWIKELMEVLEKCCPG